MATFACVAIWEVTRGLRWLNLPLGILPMAMPWLLDYDWTPLDNSSLCGLAIAQLAVLPTDIHQSYGGGWPVLFAR